MNRNKRATENRGPKKRKWIVKTKKKRELVSRTKSAHRGRKEERSRWAQSKTRANLHAEMQNGRRKKVALSSTCMKSNLETLNLRCPPPGWCWDYRCEPITVGLEGLILMNINTFSLIPQAIVTQSISLDAVNSVQRQQPCGLDTPT